MTDEAKNNDGRALNLKALDPQSEPEHFERLIGRVRRAATPELIRRQEELERRGELGIWGQLGLWGQIARWRRAILFASGALAAASLLVLLLVQPASTSQGSLAESLGIPETVAEWIESGEQPGPGDLLSVNGSE